MFRRLWQALYSCLKVLLFLSGACLVPAAGWAQHESPRDLFEKGKAEFKIGSYRSSLATFERLDQVSRQPGLEQERLKLEPVIAFYRGANLAALGEKKAAAKEFEAYLASFPTAQLDPGAFPSSVIKAFQAAREEFAARNAKSEGKTQRQDGEMAAAYARFRPEGTKPSEEIDESWAEGPVRYIATKAEKAAWESPGAPVSRAEFVSKFWQVRDPDSLTPANEFREEFEKRTAFADAYFTKGEKKGSDTDRGMVFILLGPPTYASQVPLTSENDPIQVARAAPEPVVAPGPRGRNVVDYVPRNPLTAEVIKGTREVWYYRRDRLPKSVGFSEVQFEFLSKAGYGEGILQRDPSALAILEDAKRQGAPVQRD